MKFTEKANNNAQQFIRDPTAGFTSAKRIIVVNSQKPDKIQRRFNYNAHTGPFSRCIVATTYKEYVYSYTHRFSAIVLHNWDAGREKKNI